MSPGGVALTTLLFWSPTVTLVRYLQKLFSKNYYSQPQQEIVVIHWRAGEDTPHLLFWMCWPALITADSQQERPAIQQLVGKCWHTLWVKKQARPNHHQVRPLLAVSENGAKLGHCSTMTKHLNNRPLTAIIHFTSYLHTPEDWLQPDSSTEVCTDHTGFLPRSPGSGRNPETTNKECMNCLDFWVMKARLYYLMVHNPKMEKSWFKQIKKEK